MSLSTYNNQIDIFICVHLLLLFTADIAGNLKDGTIAVPHFLANFTGVTRAVRSSRKTIV